MPLTHCIIHHLERPAPGHDVQISVRETDNSVSGPAYSLFEQLKHTFLRSGQKQYGHFDKELSDNPSPGWLKAMQESKSSFSSTSLMLMEHLKNKLEACDEAFSTHIMYAMDDTMDQNSFYIFWAEHTDAMHINNELETASTKYISTSRLPYAAKIQLNEWLEEGSPKYLTLLASRGNKALATAFQDFLGFSNSVDLAQETNDFLELVEKYVEELPEEKSHEQKSHILDYCVEQDKIGKPIVFEDISNQLDDKSPEKFSSFIVENQATPTDEIYTDRGSLKRYMRYFGRDKNLSISFSADMLGSNIVYDNQTGSLTIHQIPKSLKQQFSKKPQED
ncbi:nucleoid-associated protein [bacterium]|nr:nucleoid-associated protein [bacterium]